MNWTKLRFRVLSNRVVGRILIALNYKKLSSYTSSRWKGITFEQEISRCIKLFCKDEHLGRIEKFLLKVDIIWCYYRYKAVPTEYFLFDFRHISLERRSKFLTNKHKDDVMIGKVGMGDNWYLLEDKARFYDKFKDFFKRDVLVYMKGTDIESLRLFCKRHPMFILKPCDGQCGNGVRRINMEDFENDVQRLKDNVLDNEGTCLMEELIIQVPELAALNMSSVNTVRLPTFINSTGFHVLKPFVRMGREGSVVDNANKGGIFAVIDEQSGEIVTDGYNFKGDRYFEHPDSHHKLRGWVIPRWKELLKTAEEIHRTVEYYPYIGWDFALTKNGWVVIEGNWGQFDSDAADKEGIKERFDAMFD